MPHCSVAETDLTTTTKMATPINEAYAVYACPMNYLTPFAWHK